MDGVCEPAACGLGTWGTIPVDDATVYVHETAAAGGDGSMAAPVQTIRAGVDLAASRGGGRVAVGAGTYSENLSLTDGDDGVSVIGRCAQMVTVDGSGASSASAVTVVGSRTPPEVTLAGLTLAGGYIGLTVSNAIVSASSVSVEKSSGAGVSLTRNGDLTLDHVTVEDTLPDSDGNFGHGVDVTFAASLTASDVQILRNVGAGLLVSGAGTRATLVDSTVADTQAGADGSGGWGMVVYDGAALTTTGGTVAGNAGRGVVVELSGSTALLQGTPIASTQSSADGTGGDGLQVDSGGSVTVIGGEIQGNSEAGVVVYGAGAWVNLIGTAIVGTLPTGNGDYGIGLVVESGGTALFDGGHIEENADAAAIVDGAGAALTMTDSVLSDTAPSGDGSGGVGIEASTGATLTVSGTTVQRCAETGISVRGAGTVATVSDSCVRDTVPDVTPGSGQGIVVQSAASLTVTRSTMERNVAIGVEAIEAGTTVSVDACSILDTEATSTGDDGIGIAASGGATVTVTDSLVSGNARAGVVAQQPGTRVALQGTDVVGTPSVAGTAPGDGVDVLSGATMAMSACSIADNSAGGVYADGIGTALTITDTEIVGSLPAPDGTYGDGLSVGGGATATVSGAMITGNTGVGVLVLGAGATLSLQDSTVASTSPRAGGDFGTGVEVGGGATLDGEGLTIDDNVRAGVIADGAGTTISLVDTTVSGTRRGAVAGAALGVQVQAGAVLTGSDLTVSGTEGPGLSSASGTVLCDGCTLNGNSFAGATATIFGVLTFSNTTIKGTLPDAELGGGIGVYATSSAGDSSVSLIDCTIGPHPYAAVWLDGPGAYDIESNTLSGSSGVTIGAGVVNGNAVFAENGVTAWDGSTGLLLVANRLSGASAVSVLLDGASATVSGNTWSTNTVDLRQQLCSGVTPLTSDDILGVPSALVCPADNVLTAYDLAFGTLYLPVASSQ